MIARNIYTTSTNTNHQRHSTSRSPWISKPCK
jgi:hypothetical protein